MIYDADKRAALTDISIARGRWLRVRPVTADVGHEIDDVLEESMPIWDALETECVAGCCGIEAFCFWPEGLAQSRRALREVDVVQVLQRLRDVVAAGNDDDVLVSTRLNTLFVRASLVELLDVLVAGDASSR